ncbi:MAG: hypothetical protein M1813_002731 [Trichoglossum hirsutum]|nr:MAG: hypothetical protein M1813_002731 [Trichoglossum hirsutum]
MVVFSAVTRSPRVASLEASKQIQREATKRHRLPRTRHVKDEIGDTIIVAVPGLHSSQPDELEKKESKLFVTSVRVPPLPSPSSSPSPKKRKAPAFDDDGVFTARVGKPAKMSSRVSRRKSHDIDDTGNLTPPATPREVVSDDIDLGEEVHQHQTQRSQTVDASTAWRNPDFVWVDLVGGEDACVNSLATTKAKTAKQRPRSSSPTNSMVNQPVCLYIGRHGESLRKFSTPPTKKSRAPKKMRGVSDLAADRDQRQDGDDCGDSAEAAPSPLEVPLSATTTTTEQPAGDGDLATTPITAPQPPRLTVDTSTQTTSTTSTTVSPGINITTLSLQCDLLASPANTADDEENASPLAIDAERQRGPSENVRPAEEGDGLIEEPDDGGGGNAMDRVDFVCDGMQLPRCAGDWGGVDDSDGGSGTEEHLTGGLSPVLEAGSTVEGDPPAAEQDGKIPGSPAAASPAPETDDRPDTASRHGMPEPAVLPCAPADDPLSSRTSMPPPPRRAFRAIKPRPSARAQTVPVGRRERISIAELLNVW